MSSTLRNILILPSTNISQASFLICCAADTVNDLKVFGYKCEIILNRAYLPVADAKTVPQACEFVIEVQVETNLVLDLYTLLYDHLLQVGF